MDCEKVKSFSDCKKILSEKNCFNCTGIKHRAVDSRTNRKYLLCKCKHHTSICEKCSDVTSEIMLTSIEWSVIYPVVTIKVNGMKCRAHSGSSYGSEAIIDLLKLNPIRK